MLAPEFARHPMRLKKSGFASLNDARGVEIHCRSGLLWVTAECDRRDYVLRAGQSLEIRTRGRVVIEAERDSELQLLPPHGDAGNQVGIPAGAAALAQ